MALCAKILENPLYMIYSDGRLFNSKTNKFLKGKVDNIGYLSYTFKSVKTNKRVYRYAHRLVAQAFIPNPDNLPAVNHIDENRLNNDISNLEWVTYQENYCKYLENHVGKRHAKAEYFVCNFEGEEWADLKNYPMYQISSYGRIMNKKTKRILKQDTAHTYARIALYNEDKEYKHEQVHRLVYCSFANDYNLDNYVIDHIDANPLNNNFDNLQKITQSENTLKQARNQTKRFND
mgnify:CR=1 FL=1